MTTSPPPTSPPSPVRHVVWDWNGTLCADQDLVVAALNDTLAGLGQAPVTAARYRALYTRPVRRFYDRLFGRPLSDDEWHRVDTAFHATYLSRLHTVGLAADAEAALDRAADAGLSQSLLSMFHHAHLVPLVRRLGIADRFVRVDGTRRGTGGTKHRHLARHIGATARDAATDPSTVLVVGDALDDAAAAAHVGARCVLYDGGSHPRSELEAAGVPVVDSLVAALGAVA